MALDIADAEPKPREPSFHIEKVRLGLAGCTDSMQFLEIIHNRYQAMRFIPRPEPVKLIAKNRDCNFTKGRPQKQSFLQIGNKQ
ncbi:hypothetical protein MesoLj131b_77090 (plasmid) [Mesorhizobium sp. 131-2-5]|nr:hypothetical protein MesoLj131b_77090 [Mesorhizobium sp. 131-2-5]